MLRRGEKKDQSGRHWIMRSFFPQPKKEVPWGHILTTGEGMSREIQMDETRQGISAVASLAWERQDGL